MQPRKQNNTVDPNAEESLGQSEEGKAEEEERRAKLRLFRLESLIPYSLLFLSDTPISISKGLLTLF